LGDVESIRPPGPGTGILSAIGREPFQKFEAVAPNRKRLRQNRNSVAHIAHEELLTLHLAVKGGNGFIPVVEVAVDGEHGVTDLVLPIVVGDELGAAVGICATGDVTAGETILIVNPGVHPRFFRLINAGLYALHPVRAQVGCDQPGPMAFTLILYLAQSLAKASVS